MAQLSICTTISNTNSMSLQKRCMQNLQLWSKKHYLHQPLHMFVCKIIVLLDSLATSSFCFSSISFGGYDVCMFIISSNDFKMSW